MAGNIGDRARELLARLEREDWQITSADHATLLEFAEHLRLDLPVETFRSRSMAAALVRRTLESHQAG